MQTFTEHLLQTRDLDAEMEKAQLWQGSGGGGLDGHGQLQVPLAGPTLPGTVGGCGRGISGHGPLPDTSTLPAGRIPTNV